MSSHHKIKSYNQHPKIDRRVLLVLLTGILGACSFNSGPTPESGSTIVSEKDGMVMVYVPAGGFTMGSDEGDQPDEKPEQRVNLDAFWIYQTEVTNGMYARCVSDDACVAPAAVRSRTRDDYYGIPAFDNFPVIYVNWDQANAYCAWADGRLPTEAEWEKAARGSDGIIYPWGDDEPNDLLANFNMNVGDVAAAGSYPDGASMYGALDMAGNVTEWVSRMYKPYPYDKRDGRESPGSFVDRVLRGGAWLDEAVNIRSAYRNSNGSSGTNDSIGFRCALPKP